MSISDARLVGVDGCPDGWLAVGQTASGAITWDVFRSAESLFSACFKAQVIAIDVPIGIPDSGQRASEAAARALLGARASSVFNVPPRPCLETGIDYLEACSRSLTASGKKISKQSFAILPKIADVDALMRTNAFLARRVWEVHPEVSFATWFGGKPARFPKASGFGFAERFQFVEASFPGAARSVREGWKQAQLADDDILDAFAALWTAQRIDQGIALCIGDRSERDPFGLPMCLHA